MRDFYRFEESAKIRVLIFNHIEFLNPNFKKRPPATGVKLENFFSNPEWFNYFGSCRWDDYFFKVSHLYDRTRDEIKQELVKVSEDGLNYSAVIVCVSSHGGLIKDEDNIFYEIIEAKDGFYYKTDLWRPFKDKEDWRGKPKLFFIQACRGGDPTAGVVLCHDGSDEQAPVFTEMKYPDLFIMNASQQGTVSWRTSNGGSLFFDALINVFKEKGDEWDLLSMAVEISNRVARDQEVCPHLLPPSQETNEYTCCQQMPCFETTLTKKLFFKDATCGIIGGKYFYQIIEKPLAIVLNYSYEGTQYPNNRARAELNTNEIKVGLSIAGYMYEDFWNVSKTNLPKLLKAKHKSNNKDMILVVFNGYGERDELYLNDEKIKVYELWEALLPKIGKKSSGKPKIFIISASPPYPELEGVSGKIDKLCKPQKKGNVEKCVHHLGGGQVNVPRTVDLLVCYETAAARTNYKLPGFNGSPFLKMFSDELMDNEDNEDFFDIIYNVIFKFSEEDNHLTEQVPLAFSTLRKLIPVRNINETSSESSCEEISD